MNTCNHLFALFLLLLGAIFNLCESRVLFSTYCSPQRDRGDVCILQTLLSFSSLTVKGKRLLNNGCNPLSSTETLSSPLFKSLSPSLSGHTPLLLIIKCRNRAPCFITCATLEMINNPCLVTIYHVSARQEEETVMKCPITT